MIENERRKNMKVSRKSTIAILAICGTLLLTGCTQPKTDNYKVTGDIPEYFVGKDAKRTYKAFLGSGIKTLNYLSSQDAANSRHIANFVDSLLMNDEYTILRKNLAESVSQKYSYKEFTFNLKHGIKWFTWDGEVYKNDLGEEQEVIADDFVVSAEAILNYGNSSDLAYLLNIFLDGGYEYYCYTMMSSLMIKRGALALYPSSGTLREDGEAFTAEDLAAGLVTPDCKFDYSSLKKASDDLKAAQLKNLIAYESGKDPRDLNISADVLPDIANFKRVGVKVGENKYQLIYTLDSSMNYFPTVLTYCPFLPTNRGFYEQYKSSFGKSKDRILYCGPYLLEKSEGSDIIYKKNPNYFNADQVHIDRIEYKILTDTVGASYRREQFEEGNIDGFGLSRDDSTGWEKYLTGPDGTGTYQNPYSGYVNARELDEIDFLYSFNVNLNRSTTTNVKDSGTNAKSNVTGAEVANANRALHITEVRKMIMDGLALTKYGQVFVDKAGTETPTQYAVNTIIPKGFARDTDGTDYVEYFFEEYANKTGITVDESRAMWEQQQYAGREYEDTPEDYAEYRQTVEAAKEAITKYNAAIDAGELLDHDGKPLTADQKVTYPIKFEALGLSGQDPDYKQYEYALFEDLNEKTNGCRINADDPYTDLDLPLCGKDGFTDFIFSVNTKVTDSTTASEFSSGAYYTLGLVWGWGPDYADPLTYMNCYTNKGDMTKYLGYDGDTMTYYLDAQGNIASKKIAGEYTDKVNEAKAETEDVKTRYALFAEAEYMLHTDMYVVKPVHMNTQGWTASISRAAGYQNPSASYGLAGQRMTGMWVLKEVPLASERAIARAKQAELKIAAVAAAGGYIDIY